jgi:glycolate oxidase iron-sulfur subunit
MSATPLPLEGCQSCHCDGHGHQGLIPGGPVGKGHDIVEKARRRIGERARRWLLRKWLTSPLLAPAVVLGQFFRPLLPTAFKEMVPAKASPRAYEWPWPARPRKVLMLTGCLQPVLAPNINAATARVLDAAGIEVMVAWKAQCCGAIRSSLSDPDRALDDMRRNIDAWTPMLHRVEAIVMTAPACSSMVKSYGEALRHDPRYAARAERVSAMAKDLSELLPDLMPLLAARLATAARVHGQGSRRVALHVSCSTEHGQDLQGNVEAALRALGREVSRATGVPHLCCGMTAGQYRLQRKLRHHLRDLALSQLQATAPEVIVCDDLGCMRHLQGGTALPVMHWVEVLDDALTCA